MLYEVHNHLYLLDNIGDQNLINVLKLPVIFSDFNWVPEVIHKQFTFDVEYILSGRMK